MSPLADNLIQQGILQLNQGRTNDAVQTFQSVLSGDPNQSAAAYYLGLIRYQEPDYAAAKALLKIAAHHDRGNFQARLYLGYACYYLNELADAKTEFQRALKLEPKSADVHLALALILEKGGDRSGAGTHSRRAIQLAPDNTEMLNFHVRLLMDAGQFEAARSTLQQSLAIDPKNSRARAAEILIEIALHNLEAAQSLFANLEAEAADWLGLNMLRANIFLARDQPEDAIKLLRQMSGDQQDSLSIALMLGKALIACDAPAEAVAIYRDLLKTVTGNFELHFDLSRALKAQGKFDESLIELNEALRIDPSEGNIYYRALVYFARGDYAKGAADYEFRWHSSADGYIRRPFQQPAWRPGTDLKGETVLVWGEQGVGDQILFGGLLPWLASTTGRCIFECDERLAPAFQRAFPGIEVVGAAAKPDKRALSPDITMQIPLASLMAAIPGWPDHFEFAARYLEPDKK
ncbi:MAG: tetratricopeptide repeat protein [Rhodospirillaceae bacterium]|jgi:tetratricopeptide (TPR) repeat protein|nr:tetratricopeptide repeat protein [Rhodospirillaceae bacterium]MBT3886138.1 tetratricopeptide repeat protein [Rhodospirillaceae bacterium]MBT4118209.1 tetratricopeptide repeat protein [Rhodospirillaceae bacterium]MBT4673052.1 tetratricopeptide repeat protein [Rhodospirillaceae bacterium]MBT4721007.1 tetratricopeptide repeat protein [Rhodospirillaceae bacterium]